MTNFEAAHEAFVRSHLERRTGERRGRLERGHGHGEVMFLRQVWWPLKGHFDDLHPEYEVIDWRHRPYFADFAYLPEPLKFLLEIKGFGPHVADADRKRYSEELSREVYLQGLGHRVISFSYDDIAQRPDHCISLLRLIFSQYEPSQAPVGKLALEEKEIIRLALSMPGSLRPVDVEKHLQCGHRTAIRGIHSLCQKG